MTASKTGFTTYRTRVKKAITEKNRIVDAREYMSEQEFMQKFLDRQSNNIATLTRYTKNYSLDFISKG